MPAAISSGSAVTRSALPPPTDTFVAANNQPMPPMPSVSTDDAGYGWSAVGGVVMTVAPGETLNNIAVKYGVPPAQILNANQLTSASQITSGRILVIPHRVALTPEQRTYQAPAPFAAAASPAPVQQPAPRAIAAGDASYVVQSGDTLYSIARRSGASLNDLVALNGLSSADTIRVGQRLTLPAGANTPATLASAPAAMPRVSVATASQPMIRLNSPAETAATGAAVANVPRVPAAPSIPVENATPAPTTVAAAAVIDETADPPSVDGTSFRWPVRGRIISGFGTKPNGERNDGINLAVPEGTSVKAAEAGTVIYAGNELEGYGNLVLIRHADGWVTAYAHNRELLVERGDTVRRGQTIARAGMTGSVTAPQVHFELRKGAKPTNPLDYLAS